MTIFSILIAITFLFAALVCYVSCYAAGRADRISEEYYRKKMQEKNSENLKNSENSDII